MEFKDIRNESGLKFTDISCEKSRTYVIKPSIGSVFTLLVAICVPENYRQYFFTLAGIIHIDNPLGLNVSDSGGHRVIDSEGRCYYIKPEWDQICWMARDGKPHFVC